MATELLPDALWTEIEPLLPLRDPSPSIDGSRSWLSDRAALTGIIFVLTYAIPWNELPQELGCGSDWTYLRRLEEWLAAGVWKELHCRLLAKLRLVDRIDWSRVAVDAGGVPSPPGRRRHGPQPHRLWQTRHQASPAGRP